ncbi:hypothetical protein ACFX2I_034041 [Malus domestica]
MWLLGFEPRSPRPQRGILTTKLQPLMLANWVSYFLISVIVLFIQNYTFPGPEKFRERLPHLKAYHKSL